MASYNSTSALYEFWTENKIVIIKRMNTFRFRVSFKEMVYYIVESKVIRIRQEL
jgi:hypothetical protein